MAGKRKRLRRMNGLVVAMTRRHPGKRRRFRHRADRRPNDARRIREEMGE